MRFFKETMNIKQWQGILLLAMSGFAAGTILAKVSAALGL